MGRKHTAEDYRHAAQFDQTRAREERASGNLRASRLYQERADRSQAKAQERPQD